jgi:hypothetical protein
MRSLSRSEGAVLGAVLADAPAGDRERMRRAGIPRTTFQSVRRRGLRAGWFSDRLVPRLAGLGVDSVECSLLQPYAEQHRAELADAASLDRTVILWDLGSAVLSVEFGREDERGSKGRAVPPKGRSASRGEWRVRIAPDSGSMPVCFDFEGAWSASVLGQPPWSYPRALRFEIPDPALGDGARPAVNSSAFAEYLRRCGASVRPSGMVAPWSAFRAGRWERWFQEHRWVERRAFLNPWALPPVPPLPGPGLAFLYARLRPGVEGGALFARLRESAGIAPFLLVEDGRRALLGAMTSPALRGRRGVSVIDALSASLEGIEVFRCGLGSVRAVVDYRFDRAARPGAGPGPSPAGGGFPRAQDSMSK